jgi:phosphoglycolate phosphatase
MRFKAALFDLDGTLVDSLEDIAAAMNRVLSEQGYAVHPIDDYRMLVGSGLARLVERALPVGASDAVRQQCAGEFRDIYREAWHVKTRIYEGIPALLQSLSERGLPMAVLSNKPHPFTVACVEHYLAGLNFAVVLGQRDGVPHKPDPTGAWEIAKQLAVSPSSCLLLGDTSVDMHTACNAGMFPVGACWGFRDRDELREAGAAELVERPEEVLAILE